MMTELASKITRRRPEHRPATPMASIRGSLVNTRPTYRAIRFIVATSILLVPSALSLAQDDSVPETRDRPEAAAGEDGSGREAAGQMAYELAGRGVKRFRHAGLNGEIAHDKEQRKNGKCIAGQHMDRGVGANIFDGAPSGEQPRSADADEQKRKADRGPQDDQDDQQRHAC